MYVGPQGKFGNSAFTEEGERSAECHSAGCCRSCWLFLMVFYGILLASTLFRLSSLWEMCVCARVCERGEEERLALYHYSRRSYPLMR